MSVVNSQYIGYFEVEKVVLDVSIKNLLNDRNSMLAKTVICYLPVF